METIADQLERLENLREKGSISEHEFAAAKANVINGRGTASAPVKANSKVFGFESRTWCTLMHISQLFIFAAGIGIVVPIVMWAMSKDHSDEVRLHGNRMMNWIVSSLLAKVVAGLLCFILIGFPILFAILVMDAVFPVIAALKANDREFWKYPMAYRFFPEE